MGGSLSSRMKEVMDDNMRKQQEFMLGAQQMQLERQVQMQLQMRERMIATQLAMVRERMYWFEGFSAIVFIGCTAGYLRTRNQGFLAPLVPLLFVVGYQADMAWGTKMERIVAEADDIIAKERNMLRMPGRPLTVALIDDERANAKK